MGKYGSKNKVSLNPLDYNIGLLGESGIGKSTLMKEVCEKLVGDEGYMALDIGREDGHAAIEGIQTEKVETWKKFADVVDDIIENKTTDYPKLKTIIVDTYDELCRLAELESIRLWNKKAEKPADTINSAWGGYGKGLDKTIELMLDKLWELKKVGVNFIIIAHVKRSDMTDIMTEQQYSILTSNTTQKYFGAIKQKLHFLGLAYVDREIVQSKTNKKNKDGEAVLKGKIAGESRVINFRDDTYSVDSKSRFADIIDQVSFTADEFIKAMQNAILAERAKSGRSLKDDEKRQVEQDKKKEQAAKEYSENKRKLHIDSEKNEALIEIIKQKFLSAEDDVKAQVKEIMAEYSIENFKSVNVATEGLEKIVQLLT